MKKLFNKINIKVIYRCAKYIRKIIENHDKKLLNNSICKQNKATCNSRLKRAYPMEGSCLEENIVYLVKLKAENKNKFKEKKKKYF